MYRHCQRARACLIVYLEALPDLLNERLDGRLLVELPTDEPTT